MTLKSGPAPFLPPLTYAEYPDRYTLSRLGVKRTLHFNKNLTREYWQGLTADAQRAALDISGSLGGELEISVAQSANLVSSLCTDGLHRPALDLDYNHINLPYVVECLKNALGDGQDFPEPDVWIAPSSNHLHLYVSNWPMSQFDYMEFLRKLIIIDEGYRCASQERGQSLLRLPHCPKWEVGDHGEPEKTPVLHDEKF